MLFPVLVLFKNQNKRDTKTIVTKIQNSRNDQNGLIINAGGYTHTSVAIHDALKIIKFPNRKGDMVKVISNNTKLKKFIKWKPKFNNLNKIVKSCITWERKIN